jgi:transposase
MIENKYAKRFDPEYKKEIVRLVEELGQSPTQVARDVGVTPQTIRAWVRKFGNGDPRAFPGEGHLHPADEEVKQMKTIKWHCSRLTLVWISGLTVPW